MLSSSFQSRLLGVRMDVKSLSELLKGTIDPTVRNEAEKKLAEVHKIIGFGPVLLHRCRVVLEVIFSINIQYDYNHDDPSHPPGGDVRRGGAACPPGRCHLLEEHGESLDEGFVISSCKDNLINDRNIHVSFVPTASSLLLQLVTFPDITLASGDIKCALQVGPGLG